MAVFSIAGQVLRKERFFVMQAPCKARYRQDGWNEAPIRSERQGHGHKENNGAPIKAAIEAWKDECNVCHHKQRQHDDSLGRPLFAEFRPTLEERGSPYHEKSDGHTANDGHGQIKPRLPISNRAGRKKQYDSDND